MDKQRRIFISRMAAIAAGSVLYRPLSALAAPGIGQSGAKEKNSSIFLQDTFLNQQLADALCTLIVIGYAKNCSDCNFQYDGTIKDYQTVAGLLSKKAGLTVSITKSKSVAEFPFIVALNKKISTIDKAINALSGDYTDYLREINKNANAKKPAPRGAYIGGMSTISKLFIVGPSKLDQYKPQYRLPDDKTIKDKYEEAKKNTNNAIEALAEVKQPLKSAVTNADLNARETRPFATGSLFKSYHGMIQAMVNYKTTIDTNSFIFEIALGENTTKVSSCFPCSTFMAANGTPASSTHLGRGDNWNIPAPPGDLLYKAWAAKISEWYQAGKEAIKKPVQGSPVANLLGELNRNNRERDIHNIFLEALTFEGAFTDRIINTLG